MISTSLKLLSYDFQSDQFSGPERNITYQLRHFAQSTRRKSFQFNNLRKKCGARSALRTLRPLSALSDPGVMCRREGVAKSAEALSSHIEQPATRLTAPAGQHNHPVNGQPQSYLAPWS